MLKGSLIVVAVALVALTGSAQKAAPARSDSSSDVRFLMSEIRRIHPNPFHTTPEPAFQAAADDLAARAPSLSQDQLLVELMRFVNLLGEREGHSGIFTLDSGNARTFHVYPLYLYKFRTGCSSSRRRKNEPGRLAGPGDRRHARRRARAEGASTRPAGQRGDAHRSVHELHADRRGPARGRPPPWGPARAVPCKPEDPRRT